MSRGKEKSYHKGKIVCLMMRHVSILNLIRYEQKFLEFDNKLFIGIYWVVTRFKVGLNCIGWIYIYARSDDFLLYAINEIFEGGFR